MARQAHQFKHQYARNHVFAADPGLDMPNILYVKDGPVATIGLNRPEKANVLSDFFFDQILAALNRARLDADVRVVVLRGEGKGFCAGYDLDSGPESGEIGSPVSPDRQPVVREYVGYERRRCGGGVWMDLSQYPKPVIAQVHGYALGVGFTLAACCDFLIAAEDTQLGVKGFGDFPTGLFDGGEWPVGSQIFFCNSYYDAEANPREWERAGLITRVVPRDQLEGEVRALAAKIAAMPPERVALNKSLVLGLRYMGGLKQSSLAHMGSHMGIQWVRWRPDDTAVNFYRTKSRAGGFKGFKEAREERIDRIAESAMGDAE